MLAMRLLIEVHWRGAESARFADGSQRLLPSMIQLVPDDGLDGLQEGALATEAAPSAKAWLKKSVVP